MNSISPQRYRSMIASFLPPHPSIFKHINSRHYVINHSKRSRQHIPSLASAKHTGYASPSLAEATSLQLRATRTAMSTSSTAACKKGSEVFSLIVCRPRGSRRLLALNHAMLSKRLHVENVVRVFLG
jgi:hypothetical protein